MKALGLYCMLVSSLLAYGGGLVLIAEAHALQVVLGVAVVWLSGVVLALASC